jgi:hypothetical protein
VHFAKRRRFERLQSFTLASLGEFPNVAIVNWPTIMRLNLRSPSAPAGISNTESRGNGSFAGLTWQQTVAVTLLIGWPKKGLSNMDAKLRVVGGRFSGHTIQVSRGKLLIGRAEDCDLRPESEFVSGYHCVLLLDEYTLRVRDLGSKNGTLVNGRRTGTGVTILLHDDMVSIGEMNILVDLSPAAAPADSVGAPFSPSALEGTGVFEGDTLQAEIADVFSPPSTAPSPAPVNPNVAAPPADELGSRE